MQTILKGYVLRLYPTDKQKELINKTIGCTRFVYNHFLDEKINDYKTIGKSKYLDSSVVIDTGITIFIRNNNHNTIAYGAVTSLFDD